MHVSEAIATRRTCRAFLPKPVDESIIRTILREYARSPSGGNLQPWHLEVLTGPALVALKATVAAKIAKGQFLDQPMEYLIYPPDLAEPFATRRERVGEQMYDAMGIARDDGAARFAQILRNFEYFGAPVGMLLFTERTFNQGQWADLGIFLQSIMLLAREHGLHTAPLESWAMWHQTVRDHLGLPDDLMLYCGLALGHMDETAPVNQWRAERASLREWVTFRGFSQPE